MKTIIGIVLAVVVLGLAVSCTSTPQPAAQAPAAAPAAAAKPIVLKMNNMLAPNHAMSYNPQMIADLVKQKSNGRLQIEVYHGDSLIKTFEAYKWLEAGAADIAMYSASMHAGATPEHALAFEFPLFLQNGLPLKEWLDAPGGYRSIVTPVYAKGGIKPLSILMYIADGGPWHMLSRKPIKSLADYKGLVTRTVGGLGAWMDGKLGAAPMQIALGEVYEAMQRGVVDAMGSTPDGLVSVGVDAAAKYALEPGWIYWNPLWAMTEKRFAEIPPDLQKVLTDSFREGEENWIMKHRDVIAESKKTLRDRGVTYNRLSDADQKEMEKLFDQYWEEQGKKYPFYLELRDSLHRFLKAKGLK